MRINKNYLKKSSKSEMKIDKIDFDDIRDIRFSIVNEFWNGFKNDKNILSFWFAPKEPLDKDRYFNIHYSQAPYYQFGTMYYPAGTTKPKFYKFILETKSFSNSYRSDSLFIRFTKQDLGKTFYLIKGKLEISDKPTLYTPCISDLESNKQALLPPEGDYKEIQPM